ncbi:hypothetical protein INS49_015476 [Diaporthe citri]|uniref:uncharacterized protein n=1 Tax=Diaporthe citri TaxID=83186 RepID=UPI001C81D450|nr:uncharacterized protein INS49_015476 [Diaporthe citri]KAG6356091.1 hypothetical protein INS49_015476 [Diaporthe citri]
MAEDPTASAAVNDGENRIVGMMVGSAVADAAGIYTDGLTKAEVETVYGRPRILASYKANELTVHYPDDHRAKYQDGDWSEVTEMALCSLFSYVHDPNPGRLPRRLRQLSRDGNRAYGLLPLDLGQPTKDIVESANYISDTTGAALQRWRAKERGIRDRNGSNAPLIRIHPVAAVAIEHNLNWTMSNAADNCRVTHVDSRCNVSVVIAIALLRGLLRQEVQTEQQINPLIQRCKRHIDFWARNVDNPGDDRGAYFAVSNSAELSRLLTAKSLQDLQLDSGQDRGDVWKCLGAGVYCLRTVMTRLESLSGRQREDTRKVLFAELIDALIKEGGAAQANAAFAGALLGAYLGYDAIPEAWRKGLSDKSFLMRKCKLLCTFVRVIPGDEYRERDSQMYPARNASERRAMQGTIQNRRRSRKQMLQRRWDDPNLMRERRRTVYGSLKFPAKGN